MKKQTILRCLSISLTLILLTMLLGGCATSAQQPTNPDGTLILDGLSADVSTRLTDFVRLPFSYLLSWLYDLTGNYGLALIFFALLLMLLLFFPTAKGKKSSMKMSRLTPQVKALEEKYGDDKRGYQMAVNQLYQDEGAGGCGGCLWLMLPLLLLFPLYHIVREPITWLMFHGNISPRTLGEIKNVFITAKNNAAVGSELAKLDLTGYFWQVQALPFVDSVKSELAAISPVIHSMDTRFLGIELSAVPHFMFWNYFETQGVWNSVGQFLLPVFSAGTSLIATLVSQKTNNSLIVNDKGEQDSALAKTASQNNMMMTLMSPLMSFYFGFVLPAALSLYWTVQGIVRPIQDYFLTKHYRKIYDAEDAIKQEKAAREAAQEAERERIRAQRRAENPDGMIGSASKKKLQQREKNEQAAKEAAYQASQMSPEERERALEEKLPEDRPYRRGRNYNPDRYKNNKE
ncbi:MAG: membrane protein insertase YidC [Oscillospiraceae bacterium]|nr:membrane protein insertase YidC [Oscillospiraceae bacterium]